MPMLIKHIDAIAREKKRDVLFLAFKDAEVDLEIDWYSLPVRRQIIAWLEENQIIQQACGWFASTNCMMSYRGQIYIDVPFDETDPVYQKLRDYLEFPDGTIRFPGVRFYVVKLEHAMENAHHDEPGFWEKWAENF